MRLHSVARLARILAEPQELVDLLETAAHEACSSLGAAVISPRAEFAAPLPSSAGSEASASAWRWAVASDGSCGSAISRPYSPKTALRLIP